jgi:hypothetical protein
MGILSLFRRIDRKRWFLCSNCLTLTSHDTMKSLFYYDGAPESFLGRPLTRCPRCGSTNTRSFQDIKNDGSESALWGLERIARKHPRSQFEVNGPKR